MSILSAVVLLGVLIFVHEFGHFLFAKLLGVKVLRFSLGFGPRLLGWTFGETEYRVSAIPLGGYVKMLGQSDTPQEEEEIPEAERHKAYNFQPLWKRFSIVFSGPFFNLVFAAFIFFCIFTAGVPVPYPEIGKVAGGSPAQRAGLMTGDKVLEIEGKKIQGYDEIETFVEEEGDRSLRFRVKRGEAVLDLQVIPERKTAQTFFGEPKDVWEIGVSPLLFPVVGGVMKGMPAERAGLRKGDRIAEVEGVSLKTWQDMTDIIHGSPGRPLRFRVERGGKTFELSIVPERKTIQEPGGKKEDIGLIGISPEGHSYIRKYGPVGAVSLGLRRTWDLSVITLVSFVKIIQRVIPADTIGGPILIFQMAGEQASQGAASFFSFMAVISINLGVLNLLPVPVLDGGHIAFLGIEAIRRKPLSEKTVMMAQRIGLALLLTLMVFAFYNDIIRLVAGSALP